MIKVADNLFRSARPKDLRVVRDAGIKTIISLESGMYELLNNDEREFQYPPDFGIKYYAMHSSGIFPPSERIISDGLRVIRNRDVDGPVLVHCFSGVDRTGILISRFQMRELGWKPVDAYLEWVKMGRHWWFDWWW